MLTRSSLNAAYPLAEQLAAKGFALRALPETPLAALINASMIHAHTAGAAAAGQLETQADTGSLLMEGAAFADTFGDVPHDKIMAESVKMIADSVAFNLDLARNTVNPIIKDVVASAQAYMDNSAQSSLSPLTVVPFYYKAIWDSPILRELVERHGNQPVTDMPLQSLQIEEPSDFAELLKQGGGRFDEEIAEFAQACGHGFLSGVWHSTFGPDSHNSVLSVLRHTYACFDVSLATFLMARRLQADIPSGVNMELSQWQAYVSTIQAQAGRAVCRALEKRALDLRMKNLVILAPNGDDARGDVLVVGDVYDNWLREGGSTEILFGALCNNGDTSYVGMLTYKDINEKAWKRTYSLLQTNIAFRRFNDLVAGLRAGMTKAINSLDDKYIVVDRAVLHERLKERLTHVKQKDLEDIYNVARKAVCRVMFPHTDAEQMLLAIDASAAAHPELDIREAALLATIDFVARWISKLSVVETVPDYGN